MNLIRLLHFIVTIPAISKASDKGDDGSALRTSGSGLTVKKKLENKEEEKETSIFQSIFRSPKRMLEAAASRFLQPNIDITLDLDYFDCCDDDEENDDENSPSPTSSMNPSASPTYSQKKFFFSSDDTYTTSCSMTDDYVVIGLPFSGCKGEAYLFKLDGTEVKKLTPGDFGYFGYSVSMDEKIVVDGEYYFRVFSRDGIYERTIKCDDCTSFGGDVATLGNLIVTSGEKNKSLWKLFIFTTEGELLKELDYGDSVISVAMSEQYIVVTEKVFNSNGYGKTFVHSNEEPDFPLITEIERAGYKVAAAGDRLVLNDGYATAWLYSTNGTLIETLELDRTSQNGLRFDIAITDEYIIAGAPWYDDLGCDSGAVFIYSAVTGEFIKKITAADGIAQDEFGHSVCTSNSHFVAVADTSFLSLTSDSFPFLRSRGEAYLFPLPS